MKRVQLVAAVLGLLSACHTMPWFVLFGSTSWDPSGVCVLDGGEWDCPDGGHGP